MCSVVEISLIQKRIKNKQKIISKVGDRIEEREKRGGVV